MVSDLALVVRAEKPAHGGYMVARPEGMPVVFIRGALPGELVEILVYERKKTYLKARAVRILEKSVHRVEDRCTASSLGAGCCAYSYTTPEYSRILKQQVVQDTLRKIADIDWDGNVDTFHSFDNGEESIDTQWRHRVRLTVNLEDNSIGFRGFHSHHIVSSVDCLQLHPALVEQLPREEIFAAARKVQEKVRQRIVQKKARKSNSRTVPDVGIDAVSRVNECYVHIVLDNTRQRHIVVTELSPIPTFFILVEGTERITKQVKDVDFKVSITSFWQPHYLAIDNYVHLIDKWIQRYKIPTGVIWDLYCGAGVLGVTLAHKYSHAQILGVDVTQDVANCAQLVPGRSVAMQCTVEEFFAQCNGSFSVEGKKNHRGKQKERVRQYRSRSSSDLLKSSGRVSGIKEEVSESYVGSLSAIISSKTDDESVHTSSDTQGLIATLLNSTVDIVIADPPRKGLTKNTAEKIRELGSEAIILLSCDIAAGARDIAILTGVNDIKKKNEKNISNRSDSPQKTVSYVVKEIHVFDAFPGTDHCECVTLLVRDNSD